MSELKPCPFCGGEAKQDTYHGDMRVKCSECDIQHLNPEADRTWNTRATPTGTIITEDESTKPPDDTLVIMRFELHSRKHGKATVKWTTPVSAYGYTLQIGDCWWPIDNMFQPPSGDE